VLADSYCVGKILLANLGVSYFFAVDQSVAIVSVQEIFGDR